MDYLADALLVGAGAGFGIAASHLRMLTRLRHEHTFDHIEDGRWTCACGARKKRGS